MIYLSQAYVCVVIIMWQHELTLIKEEYVFDSLGNQVPSEIMNNVFCDVRSISRSEFYNAATNGLKPSLVFIIHNFEYNDETKVEFEGNIYRVIRTYMKSVDDIELTCEKVLGNG